MIRNYLKIALRNLSRQKGFSIINILGLSIGLGCTIVIMLYVRHELSYDKFHKNANNIYRITIEATDLTAAVTPAPLGAAIANEIPVVSSSVRTSMYSNNLFEVGDEKFEEDKVIYADSNFLEVFSYELQSGDRATALKDAQSIILAEETAIKYFGHQDPLGKTVRMDNKTDFVVTGVLKPIINSHLHPAMLIPMSFLARTERDLINNTWDNFNYYTYLTLNKEGTPAILNETGTQIDSLYKKHEKEFAVRYSLQPLTAIHLHSNFMGDVPGHGNADYVLAFVVIAIFILIVACINFMNLSTARSARRAKEVGLRKVSGAIRSQLIGQFLSESLVISLISLFIAVLFAFVSLRFVNDLTGKQLVLDLLDIKLVAVLLGITLATGFVAGSYPALFLSGFMPAKVLKREVTSGRGSAIFRNVLVVTQFVVSVVLLAGTAIVYQQLHFIQTKSLGYAKENLIYFRMKGALWNDVSVLKAKLSQNRFTENFASSWNVPANLSSGTYYLDWDGKDKGNQVIFANLQIDENFLNVYGMTMASGRNFSKDIPADSTNYIVNEKAVKIMGMTNESAVGKSFTLWGRKGLIVGVVKDFNFKPLKQSIEPIVLKMDPWNSVVTVKAEPQHVAETISALEEICKALNPAYPFSYNFVDQDLANQYENEKHVGSLFNVFAGLAIFISCLGLYGLSAFVAEQRTKEIGIRKALGASLFHIVRLLSARFILPIAIAIVIAAPVAYYVMSKWLEGFAYQVGFGWWMFITAGVVSLCIGLFTVSFECIKAASVNPVKSLRSE